MKRFLVLIIGIVFVGLLGAAPTARAGGWAISSLDDVITPTVGTPVDVGFMILQHGVTPVDLDDGVGIQVTGPSGKTEFFPARHEGERGHYVATVVFREAGASSWSVAQGWFAPHDLGSITVGATPASPMSPGNDQSPALLRYGLPALALALGAFAVFDMTRSRRGKRQLAA
jgi:hypothetical protein